MPHAISKLTCDTRVGIEHYVQACFAFETRIELVESLADRGGLDFSGFGSSGTPAAIVVTWSGA
jgi:hypothetical protein